MDRAVSFIRETLDVARIRPGPSLTGRDVEGVLALCRLLLSAAIILSLYLEIPDVRDDARILGLSVFLALAIAAFWQAALVRRTRGAQLLHLADIAFACTLLVIGRETGMLFLVYFTFCLLSAAVRFSWRVVLATGSALCACYFLGDALGLVARDKILIRTFYMVAWTGLLARAAYGVERGLARMLRLARFIQTHPDPNENGLRATLREACEILEAEGAILRWVDARGWREDVYRLDGDRLTSRRPEPPHVGLTQGPLLLLDPHFALTIAGPIRPQVAMPALAILSDREVKPGLAIACHTFQGELTRGELYAFGVAHWRWDHLVLVELVSRHVLAQIEAQLIAERRLLKASELARARFSRDLHDGLLQNLTAVRLQLHALETESSLAEVRKRTQAAAEILRQEQERLRESIEEIRAIEDERTVPVDRVARLLETTAARWNLTPEVTTEGPDARMARTQYQEIALLVSECVANAARHGASGAIRARVAVIGRSLLFSVTNDIATNGPPLSTIAPRNMSSRVIRMGGTMSVEGDESSVTVTVEAPLQD